MNTIKYLILSLGNVVVLVGAFPSTNFASSSMSSDSSGTRSANMVGTVPGGGTGGGTVVYTSRGNQGYGNGGYVSGIFGNSNPSGGGQYTVVGPPGTKVYTQSIPPSRTASAGYGDYGYSGYGYGYSPPASAAAYAGPSYYGGGAGASSYASAGGYGGGSYAGSGFPDYMG